MKPAVSKFMKDVAVGAGNILMSRFRKVQKIEKKLNAGIVTEADHLAEKYILKKISRYFPESSIITEESGEFHRDSEWCWIIDPLDGTTNYAHGFPFFCVSIGLQVKGRSLAGVVYQPVTQEMFYAERGKGTRLNGRKVTVSKTRKLADALLGTGFYYAKGRQLRREMELFLRMNDVARGVRRPGAAALDLAYVACGRYDGFWERGLSPWDVAAGGLLVTEAGGRITNYQGKRVSIFDREILASNGALHRSIVKTLS